MELVSPGQSILLCELVQLQFPCHPSWGGKFILPCFSFSRKRKPVHEGHLEIFIQTLAENIKFFSPALVSTIWPRGLLLQIHSHSTVRPWFLTSHRRRRRSREEQVDGATASTATADENCANMLGTLKSRELLNQSSLWLWVLLFWHQRSLLLTASIFSSNRLSNSIVQAWIDLLSNSHFLSRLSYPHITLILIKIQMHEEGKFSMRRKRYGDAHEETKA